MVTTFILNNTHTKLTQQKLNTISVTRTITSSKIFSQYLVQLLAFHDRICAQYCTVVFLNFSLHLSHFSFVNKPNPICVMQTTYVHEQKIRQHNRVVGCLSISTHDKQNTRRSKTAQIPQFVISKRNTNYKLCYLITILLSTFSIHFALSLVVVSKFNFRFWVGWGAMEIDTLFS